MSIQGKNILLGVTGGIAAYKAATLCSRLAQAGARVRVVMTRSAAKFVTPLTFQTLSRQPVAIDTFDEFDPSVVQHIELADNADLVVIAPATANIMAKMAHGLADDMLSTTLLATQAPILVAPAMNVHMYDHPAVQANIRTLQQRGVSFIDPNEGSLACGYVGKGRLAEPEEILARISTMLSHSSMLQGLKVLVTAGGTIERIDPVRYITNDSSGRMGFAVAEAASRMGAEVTLIATAETLPPPPNVTFVLAPSAQRMYDEVMARFPQMDIVIKAAAVADYRPAEISPQKIKKQSETMELSLERTTDILQALGQRRTHQYIVGFAAETEHLEHHAQDKLRRKNCDLIVANDVTLEGAGFGTKTNAVKIFDQHGLVLSLDVMPKTEIAEALLALVAKRVQPSKRVE